jgi:hypothetical protein
MKPSGRFQKGASIWMITLFVVVLGFGLVFGLKLIPVYLEGWYISRAVEGALQAGSGSQSKEKIKSAILRRLDIDEVRVIKKSNFTEFMTIQKRGDRVTVQIDYERVEPLFANLSILAVFQKTITN